MKIYTWCVFLTHHHLNLITPAKVLLSPKITFKVLGKRAWVLGDHAWGSILALSKSSLKVIDSAIHLRMPQFVRAHPDMPMWRQATQ